MNLVSPYTLTHYGILTFVIKLSSKLTHFGLEACILSSTNQKTYYSQYFKIYKRKWTIALMLLERENQNPL